MSTERPRHVLLIVTDQQIADSVAALGATGLRTPGFDRLARDGVAMPATYCSDPVCGPSRATLLTGRAPVEAGVFANGLPVRGGMPTLGQWVRDHARVDTVYSGKWHLRQPHTGVIPGFDVIATGINCLGSAGDPAVTQAAEGWLRHHDPAQPSLLLAMYTQPHDICEAIRLLHGADLGRWPVAEDELPPLPPSFRLHHPEPGPIADFRAKQGALDQAWDERRWRLYLWLYHRMVEQVDAEVARLLEVLDDTGRAEDTLVIATSDHGEGVAEKGLTTKSYLYDAPCRVPFLARWPRGLPRGRVLDTLGSGYDIVPTICGALGVPPPPGCHGVDLLSHLAGGAAPERRFVHTASQGGLGQAIRTPDWRYVCHKGDGVELLFDHRADPHEATDRSRDPACRHELERHRDLLRGWNAGLAVAPNLPTHLRWRPEDVPSA